MKNILVTGSKGFIAGYLIERLLNDGWNVVGIDNNSKYGPLAKSYDNHPNYTFVYGDAKDPQLLLRLLKENVCTHFIACAAMIGGITYFHKYAYDLLAENERILAASFDAAIKAYQNHALKKITVLSSSMIYESATTWPSLEGDEEKIAPPFSTYGFQKLCTHYFCKGAWEQYQLPYTLCVPFNCIGIGEGKALCDESVKSGNIELALSHVVPDLIQKIVKGQDPLHILGAGNQVRHYTYGGDLACGICSTLENDMAINGTFNLSTCRSTSVLELSEIIWKKIKGENVPFRYVSDTPMKYDVQCRIPDVTKAKELLGFSADTGLEKALDEIIPWVTTMVDKNLI